MNTNIKNINSSWELTDAEIDAMYDEYCVKENAIDEDLGEYRDLYEAQKDRLMRRYQKEIDEILTRRDEDISFEYGYYADLNKNNRKAVVEEILTERNIGVAHEYDYYAGLNGKEGKAFRRVA